MLLISEESPLGYDDREKISSEWSSSSLLEEVANKIIETIKPTVQSDYIRRNIAEYIEKLINTHFLDSNQNPPKVFLFGSVPLKTYLPDGDLDLTVLAPLSTPQDLCNVLQEAEKILDNKFRIRNVRFIAAEVPVIKCFVDDIPVDICFFKSGEGGLHALLFLEKVDVLIGRDELFKRSVLLIKAWCFYESRILGSSHSLLSTFGLEIMILHVVNYAKDLISGPFSVLCTFLKYYSDFDWDQFGVSLGGIVVLSHLPRIVVIDPPNIPVGGRRYFADEEIQSLKRDTQEHRTFPRKFLNIFDPFVESNNIGRSVSKGNSRRIRMAMKHGYEKLKTILEMREEKAVDDLNSFFINIINKNAHGVRADEKVCEEVIPVPVPDLTSQSVTQATNDSDEEIHRVHTPVTDVLSLDYPPMQIWPVQLAVPIIRRRFRIIPLEHFYRRRRFPYQNHPSQPQFLPFCLMTFQSHYTTCPIGNSSNTGFNF